MKDPKNIDDLIDALGDMKWLDMPDKFKLYAFKMCILEGSIFEKWIDIINSYKTLFIYEYISIINIWSSMKFNYLGESFEYHNWLMVMFIKLPFL